MINDQPTREEAIVMLQDIESHVRKIECDLRNVDLLVNEDITDMFTQYSLGLSPEGQAALVNAFKEKHMKELRKQKIDSLIRVRNKLQSLKEKLDHDLVKNLEQDSALTAG